MGKKEIAKQIWKYGAFKVLGDAKSFKLLSYLVASIAVVIGVAGFLALGSLVISYSSSHWAAVEFTPTLFSNVAFLSLFGSIGVLTLPLLCVSSLIALLCYCYSLQARIKKLESKQ